MIFSMDVPWTFLLIAGFAAYFQSITGFGLGMIVMGLAGGLGLVPMTQVVAVISLMTLVNCSTALAGRLRQVYWASVGAVLLGLVPMLILGVLMLNYLSAGASALIQLLLGAVIIYGGLALLMTPRGQAEVSKPASFTVFGAISGFFGGLFEIAGPPLIYHYYRQPLDWVRLRNTLLVLFGLASAARTIVIAIDGQLNADILELTLWTLPVVFIGSTLARRWPPKLSARSIRGVAVLILLMMGSTLIVAGLSSAEGERAAAETVSHSASARWSGDLG